MRATLITLLLAAVPIGACAEDWFTVYGDPDAPSQDLIQILPSSVTHEPQTVQVRVTRSAMRRAYGGGEYRGHRSTVLVDCERREGWYTRMSFYGEPGWRGPITMERTFKAGQAPVVFNEIPGQSDRLIRAACALR